MSHLEYLIALIRAFPRTSHLHPEQAEYAWELIQDALSEAVSSEEDLWFNQTDASISALEDAVQETVLSQEESVPEQ